MGEAWTCPYCNRHATISEQDHLQKYLSCENHNKLGCFALRTNIIVCPNPECRQPTVFVERLRIETEVRCTGDLDETPHSEILNEVLEQWRLRPDSSAKPLPKYIPEAIREDYQEACKILYLSPKASATLARRCIQGMIRDFWGITKNRLVDEIEALRGKLNEEDVWRAIDAVRHMGNIGAHMEKDVNMILDVESGEAEDLIELIEFLLEDWYVARHNRQQNRNRILRSVDQKRHAKQAVQPDDPLRSGEG